MSTHQFVVTIDVDDVDGDWLERTPADSAEAALNAVGLREAGNLDGFADVNASAWITGVDRLPS
jgi:hypothetical protein